MLIHQFDELLEAEPFKRFRIVTSDGQSLLVPSREFAWHPPASRTIWVATVKGDRTHMIDLQRVTKFVIDERSNGGNGKKRRRH
jgi:hypothetical protein